MFPSQVMIDMKKLFNGSKKKKENEKWEMEAFLIRPMLKIKRMEFRSS